MEQKDTLLSFAGEFDSEIDHPDLGIIRRGTITYEYYWFDRWYNVFYFHEPDGKFRNYYCNINMPPKFVNAVFDYVDLDIDVLVQPDLSYKVLDLEEFKENAVKFNYPADVVLNAKKALNEVLGLIRKREFPFQIAEA